MTNSSTATRTQFPLAGLRLTLIRILWVLTLFFSGVIFVMNIPYMYDSLYRGITESGAVLSAFAIPPNVLAIYDLVQSSILLLGFFGIGTLLFIRKSDDPPALITSFMLITTGFIYGGIYSRNGLLWPLDVLITGFGETLQVVFFYTFPDGKFLPRWSRWFVLPLFILRVGIWAYIYINKSAQGVLEITFLVLLMVIGIGFQIYRYRKLATASQRQQLKWLLVGVVVTVVVVVPTVFLGGISQFASPTNNALLWLFIKTIRNLALLAVPVTIGLAVLRYRLWDIDLTINRSIVGAGVFIILGALFLIGFAVLQRVFGLLLGDIQSVAAIGVAGLITGAAFNPIHQRVRNFVDRNLYKFRFDLNELQKGRQKPAVKTPAALTGQVRSGYELLDVIGKGGMGEVYRGFREGEIVAVKVLPEELSQKQPEIRERFAREAQALRELNHPHIVKLLDAQLEGDAPWLILQYLEGQTLSEYISEHGKLSLEEFKVLSAQILDALAHLHAKGIVHRDIKPSNIMIQKDETGAIHPILMDFGIAKGQDENSTLTGTNAVGTIDYMAPEQIESAHDVGAPADIYALGVVFFEMLTGQRPFTGTPGQVLFAHLQQPPPDPRKLRPDLPLTVAKAVYRALDKNPISRFGSAWNMADALAA